MTVGVLPDGTVTFFFSDIQGSTRRWQEDPAMRDVLARHDQIIRDAIESHRGHWVKHTGDGVMAVFSSASDATSAAADVQRAVVAEEWGDHPLRVRIGLHTGEAQSRDDDYFGPAVNETARIMGAAHGGQVVMSAATCALADGVESFDLGTHRLADLDHSLRLHQLRVPGTRQEFPALRTLETTPNNLPIQPTRFVGRGQELADVTRLLAEQRWSR